MVWRGVRSANVLAVLSNGLGISAGFVYNSQVFHQTSSKSALALAPQQLGSFETLEFTTVSLTERRVIVEDLVSSNKETVKFEESWDWQKHLLQEHVDRIANTPEATSFLSDEQARDWNHEGILVPGGFDTIFLLEHEAVYTLVGIGKRMILMAEGMGSMFLSTIT
jgi:hypothetical protein